MGNAYYLFGQNENVLRNYEIVLDLIKKVNGKDFLKEKSVVLGNIGLTYRGKGRLDEALKYYKKAITKERSNTKRVKHVILKTLGSFMVRKI